MGFAGYILNLFDYRPVVLGEVEQYFLEEIGRGLNNSAYKMFKYLMVKGGSHTWRIWFEPAHHPMAYKNVYKRFKRLELLNLIEQTGETPAHNARYYKLTVNGWMHLRYENSLNETFMIDNNPVISALLLPFFEKKTFDKVIFAQLLHREISRYLSNSVRFTAELFGGYWRQLDRIRVTISREELKKYFGLITNTAYLDENLRGSNKFREINKSIRAFENNYPEEKTVEGDDYRVVAFPISTLEKKLESNIKNLVFSLSCHLASADPRDETRERLIKDKKFRELIKNVKEEFLQGYEMLLLT